MTDNKQYPPLPASFGHVHSDGNYCQDMEPSHESWPIDIYTAVQMRAYVDADRAMRAARDAEDAARYRWLAAHCRSTAEHWGGRWSIVVEGPAPKSHDSEDDFDAAIDAARAAKEGEPQ